MADGSGAGRHRRLFVSGGGSVGAIRRLSYIAYAQYGELPPPEGGGSSREALPECLLGLPADHQQEEIGRHRADFVVGALRWDPRRGGEREPRLELRVALTKAQQSSAMVRC